MITWLTHLRIAEKIKEKVTGVNLTYLMLGSIAPNCDVPHADEKIMHYHIPKDGDEYDIDIAGFYNKHLLPEKILLRSDRTRSFLWGYYFHLISDKLWLESYFNPLKEKYEQLPKVTDKSLIVLVEEEMNVLDGIYVRDNGIELFQKLEYIDKNIFSFGDFDTSYLHTYINQITKYYTNPATLPQVNSQFLNENMIEDFIAAAAQKCIHKLI